MKIYLFLLCLLGLSPKLWGQFLGGDGSGHHTLLLASSGTCGEFFGGGGSGHDTSNYDSPFDCIEFNGSSGSGAAAVEIKGECVMYWGDSTSGYTDAAVASTLNCIFFKGDDGSGYHNDLYDNPYTCPSFLASPSGNDGFAARSYSEDHGGLCYVDDLPIEASPLFAELRNDDDGYLYWQTYSELNNEGFEIQKSLDAVHWEDIGWVAGAGNSIETLQYDFWDDNLSAAVQYYRFRQVDFDGTASFSNIVSLSLSGNNKPQNLVQIYPNPVTLGNDLKVQTWLDFELPLRLKVHNTLGQLVLETNHLFLAGNSQHAISTHQLAAGTYFLSLEAPQGAAYWVLPFVVVGY